MRGHWMLVAFAVAMSFSSMVSAQKPGKHGGIVITRQDIERTHTRRFSDVLRRVPGMKIVCDGVGRCSASPRSAPPSGAPPAYQGSAPSQSCPIQFYVDGRYMPLPNVNYLDVHEIDSVTVWTHGQSAPIQYSMRKNARCGVVVVKTRH